MATTNNTINWDQVLWPANCSKCGGTFDCLVENHLSLCADCRKMFADCDSCGGYFDRLADGNPTRCGVCQALFGVPAPATTTAPAEPTAPTKPKREPPSKEHYVHCRCCNRLFPPNKRNTGAHCTVCCNREAAKGNDLFAKLNMQPSKEVAMLLKNAAAQKQQAAPAPTQSIAEATSAMLSGFGGM